MRQRWYPQLPPLDSRAVQGRSERGTGQIRGQVTNASAGRTRIGEGEMPEAGLCTMRATSMPKAPLNTAWQQ